MLELMTAFNFYQIGAGTDVFKFGDQGDLFFLIIRGKVSIRIANYTKIKGWKLLWLEYNKLKIWVERLTTVLYEAIGNMDKK